MGCVFSLSKDIPNASVLVITSETQRAPIAFLFDGVVSLGDFLTMFYKEPKMNEYMKKMVLKESARTYVG